MASITYTKVNLNVKHEVVDAYRRLGDAAGVPYSTIMRETLLTGLENTAQRHVEEIKRQRASMEAGLEAAKNVNASST